MSEAKSLESEELSKFEGGIKQMGLGSLIHEKDKITHNGNCEMLYVQQKYDMIVKELDKRYPASH